MSTSVINIALLLDTSLGLALCSHSYQHDAIIYIHAGHTLHTTNWLKDVKQLM